MDNDSHNPKLSSYISGFFLSVILTLSAYYLVRYHLNTGHRVPTDQIMIYLLLGLAFTQFIVQLLFFLHLGKESKPRWNLLIFISTVGLVFILVAGSIWIMSHLNYNMMPSEMNQYLIQQEGIQH